MVARAIKQRATRLVIPPGTYRFRTESGIANGQWVIRGLSDAVIDGTGATLLFGLNRGGIYVTDCQRLRLANFAIDYDLLTSSFGQVIDLNGSPALRIDDDTPVTAANQIGHIAHYDRDTLTPDPDNIRAYFGPGDTTFVGDQTYLAAQFTPDMIGKTFLVYHHYDGAAALKLMGDPASSRQTEDITVDGIWIRKSPGMGIVAFGVRRGVAIINSRIVPPDGEAASTEIDAMHVYVPGGDLIVKANRVSGAGDDNLNVDSPVIPVRGVDASGSTVTLGDYSYYVRKGDIVAAFDGGMRFQDLARVTTAPSQPSLRATNTFTLDRPIQNLSNTSFLRDVALNGNRVAVIGNTFINGGNVLVQVPNVLVSGNSFQGSGLRILSSFAFFKEGTGGLNVVVDGNTFTGGKVTNRYNFPFAALSAYALTTTLETSMKQPNRYLAIRNNNFDSVPQGCITIASSYHTEISGNVCNNSNTLTPGGFDVNLVNDVDVSLSGNSLNLLRPLYVFNSYIVY
jgi:hypothetical protein